MANALYQKFAVIDNGAWTLTWSDSYKRYADQGYTYYSSYDFNSNTGKFTLSGDSFVDTIQEQRNGYRLSGSTPINIYTYDNGQIDGDNLIWTGTIKNEPNRADRYRKGKLVETVKLPYGSVPEDGVQDGYWYVFQRMVTSLCARVGGVWYPGYALYGKVSGVWREEAQLSARINGIWH